MEEPTELAIIEDANRAPSVRLGSIDSAPANVIGMAQVIATQLNDIVVKKDLYQMFSGKRYVVCEGWTTLCAMLGVSPREVSVELDENGDYLATVELVRNSDGACIARASSICGSDEKTWATRPRYARRSMAVTRATGKAARMAFSWIMNLAGYEATPAEEMSDFESRPALPQRQAPRPAPRPAPSPAPSATESSDAGDVSAEGWGETNGPEKAIGRIDAVDSLKSRDGSKTFYKVSVCGVSASFFPREFANSLHLAQQAGREIELSYDVNGKFCNAKGFRAL